MTAIQGLVRRCGISKDNTHRILQSLTAASNVSDCFNKLEEVISGLLLIWVSRRSERRRIQWYITPAWSAVTYSISLIATA